MSMALVQCADITSTMLFVVCYHTTTAPTAVQRWTEGMRMLDAREIMELQKLSGMEKFSKLTVKQALDREKLIALLENRRCEASEVCGSMNNGFGAWYADHLIANDVVPVVRCKACDWYREDGSICVNPHCGKSFYGCRVRQDHFCSYGERKDNE